MSKDKDTVVKKENQKRHNRYTRGINTFRKGALWSIRLSKSKDKDGKEKEVVEKIRVPVNTAWDPWDKNRVEKQRAQEPFDSLHLDWRAEFVDYAKSEHARIGSVNIGGGEYLHRIFYGENVKNPDTILLEVRSNKGLTVERRRKRGKTKKVG
tara:strand:- start:192 stop:650 length:459 start_codon:yes stop_codon:yes gene_type:complete